MIAAVDRRVERRRRLRNRGQELLLLGGIAATAGAAASLVLGPSGFLVVIVAGVCVLALRPQVPVTWVLWIYGARPLPFIAAPQLHRIIGVLAARAGLNAPPTLFYVATPIANAFVAGPAEGAALAVTDGLLRVLTTRQLVGVLAHEISHLNSGDTAVMSLSDVVARLAQWLGWFGLWSFVVTAPLSLTRAEVTPLLFSALLVVGPTLISLLQLALARAREYDADAHAAALTGDPESLAEALLVLESVDGRIWERILVTRSRRPDPLLLHTHPPTADRVRRLRALEAGGEPVTVSHLPVRVGYSSASHHPRLRRTGVRW